MCDFERSILSTEPGTKRDYVEERGVLAGAAVSLVKTAGPRESSYPVEAAGIRRNRRRKLEADLLVLAIDASRPAREGELKLREEFREGSPLVVLGKIPGEITGETAGEEVVDRIFSKFCVGK